MENHSLRFSFCGASDARACSPNDLLGRHLRELLDLLIPTAEGRELRVDGYKLLSERQTVHQVDFAGEQGESPADPLELYEPRIGYLRRLVESLLGVIDFESNGNAVSIDGFRLKKPAQWLTSGGGAEDVLAHAASRCNLSCRFCYNKGAPSLLSPAPRDPAEEYIEIRERIAQYVPRARLNLFPNMGSPREILAHPHVLDILRGLRARTGEVLRIPTNGAALTEAMIASLAEVRPVYLDVSLNSASRDRRRWLMNDPSPEVAIEALGRLREARLPFSVVIVPWPFPSRLEMLEDVRWTVMFAAQFEPALIQLSLPGCTRALQGEASFPLDEVWGELKAAARELRGRIDCPLVIRPGLYEEFDKPEQVNDPRVHGVIKNSPAARAGIRPGDRICKVSGLSVRTRLQARSLLTAIHQSDIKKASLSLARGGSALDLVVDLNDYDYPYTPETASHLGIAFACAGVPQEWVEKLKELIVSHHARNVLLLSSRLVRPILERMLGQNGQFANVRLDVRIPRNDFFGGNIMMGDLLTVADFITAVREFMEAERMRPDLIVIPSSPFHLSRWGRDLVGRVYLDIERALGIPVRLLECDPIFD